MKCTINRSARIITLTYRCAKMKLDCVTDYNTHSGRVIVHRSNNGAKVEYYNRAGRLYAVTSVNREKCIIKKERLDGEGNVVATWVAGVEWEAQALQAVGAAVPVAAPAQAVGPEMQAQAAEAAAPKEGAEAPMEAAEAPVGDQGEIDIDVRALSWWVDNLSAVAAALPQNVGVETAVPVGVPVGVAEPTAGPIASPSASPIPAEALMQAQDPLAEAQDWADVLASLGAPVDMAEFPEAFFVDEAFFEDGYIW